MKRLQAFKFKLKISGAAIRDLYRIAGSCRFVYNKALSLQKITYSTGGKKLSYATLCKELTQWRNDSSYPWLKAIPSQALQQSLKDLEKAYQNFFAKRASFPQSKKRGGKDAFRFPQGVKLDQQNSRIFLPKLGWIRYWNSQSVSGEIGNVTVSRDGNDWFVSIQTEREVIANIHSSNSSIGIDVGVSRFATLSDGMVFESLKSLKKYQKKIAAQQRKLSRKQKFSQNWKNLKNKISQLYLKMRHSRQNYLHQTSHIISKNHAMICLEDLQIKNMSKSAAGTIENPGKNVKAKKGLNKAILNQGWYEFKRQLKYKQHWRGGMVILVPPKNTSRTCPNCYHIASENRRSQAEFVCMNCQYKNHADLVGAMNILRAGHARLACGETMQLGRSMNQEPAEGIQASIA